jgi:hypothetical protein
MRASEFIVDHKEEQLDEFLPLIGAAGGALARGASTAGSAIGRGAAAVGRGVVQGAKAVGSGIARGAKVVGNVVSAAKAAKAAKDTAQDDTQLKAGGRVNIPKLGAVDIIAVTSTGVTLNTQSQLGFNITVDPGSLQK